MNDIQSYEHIVKRKVKGKLLLSKIALITAYVTIAVIGTVLTVIFAELKTMLSLLMLIAAADYILFIFTWKLTCIEHEYAIAAGSFYVSRIFGKSRRKDLFEAELSRASIIAPYNEKYAEKAESCLPDRILKAISSDTAENTWFIIFEEENAKRTLIFFEATERALTALRHYAPRVTVREPLEKKENENNK